MSLDLNKMACVGLGASKRSKIRYCIEKRCEGCGEKIYLSNNALRAAERQARRQGDGLALVCEKCVEPWIQDVARNGGAIAGSKSVLESHGIPRIERAIDDQIHLN